MSETLELKAMAREKVGKGASRKLRREGYVPAVIYGAKKPPLPIYVERRDAIKQIFSGNFLTTLYDIEVDGKKTRVLPKAFDLDPVKDMPIHLDFLRVAADTEVTVEVSVSFINEDKAPGIKRGGVLNIVRHSVEVNCPANAIPDEFVVDLTGLEINDTVHISNVTLPENVTPTITDRDFTIATIASPGGGMKEPTAGEEEGEEEGGEE
ncbi:MAG: 50S ribosomal protein L25/general stress protein Ctc [Hyphomicrobiales bacterium]|nr:50S ribosomal protein L25/general stress protein Ctc [Hyphomicrobiales bacterium]